VNGSFPTLVACLLLAAAGPVAAQQVPAPAPAAAPPATAAPSPAQAEPPAATGSRPLILRLDEIDGPRMSFGRSAGEREAPRDLPSLGGDVRTLETSRSLRSSPYPTSSENLP